MKMKQIEMFRKAKQVGYTLTLVMLSSNLVYSKNPKSNILLIAVDDLRTEQDFHRVALRQMHFLL